MTNNGITFVLSMYKTYSVKIMTEFINILPFEPLTMRPALLHKKVKYNKTDHIEAFKKAINENKRFSTTIYKDYSNSICFRYDDISDVVTLILHNSDLKDEKNIVSLFERIIAQNRIVSAYLRDKLDDRSSSESQISFYESSGTDISGLKIIQDKTLKTDILDIEQFSGHSHEYGGIGFTSTYIMWFGEDYFKFVPEEILTSFKDCFSNETLKNGTVRIQLYDNINNYNTEEADRRQWAFRRHTNIDKAADDWHRDYLRLAANDNSGADMIIERDNFEHGGVRLVKSYYGSDNVPAQKKNASKMKCTEYGSDNAILYEYEVLLHDRQHKNETKEKS